MMKTLGLLAAAAAVAGLTLAMAIPALAAPPAPNCDVRFTNVVNDAHPALGSTVRFTLTASVQCNFDAVVSVLDSPLPSGLAQNPPGEQLNFGFSAPNGQRVTRTFTVGAAIPAADACNAHLTNTASVATQFPQGEGAVTFTNASAALTTRCTAPLLPATGQRP